MEPRRLLPVLSNRASLSMSSNGGSCAAPSSAVCQIGYLNAVELAGAGNAFGFAFWVPVCRPLSSTIRLRKVRDRCGANRKRRDARCLHPTSTTKKVLSWAS